MSFSKYLKLPTFATAPFCPSEIQGSVPIPKGASFWKKVSIFFGPGLLISVGYLDPGNWATDIEAGSRYGYSLLFVILLSSLAAILLQCLSMRVGIVTRRDLAQLAKEHYHPTVNVVLWLLAEVAIIATDVAEVLGAGLAFKLLLGCSLETGILITALDTFIILGLKGKGFRQIEAIILGLIATIGICYFVELILIKPFWPAVFEGYIPTREILQNQDAWYLAIGILGATVMPHNLYLHSSIVSTRQVGRDFESQRSAIRMNTLDTTLSLSLAFIVNSAILVLAAAAFHGVGQTVVTGIDDAYHLLEPLAGAGLASLLFGIALLAAGQSSTFTGTIAGQIIMEGFMTWNIPCWKRRLITRGLALIPAYLGIKLLGDHSTGRLLVLSQVVLSLQLPFTIFPLLSFVGNEKLMGVFKLGRGLKVLAWGVFALITLANLILLRQLL